MRLGRSTITVVDPAAVTTAWGLQLRTLLEADGATRRRVRDCNVQPKDFTVTLAGLSISIPAATVYAPAGSGILDTNAIEIDGDAYAVDGPPRSWRARSGRGRYLVVDLVPWDRLAPFWRHQCTLERLAGHGTSGPVFDAPETVTGFVKPGTRLVRDAAGDEVVSSTTVYLPIGTEPIPTGSVITPPPGLGLSPSRVITAAAVFGAGLDTADHIEVTLE